MNSIELTSNKINDDGFTLIEVLIAMVIFALGILAVAQMQIRALHANADAFSQTEATMWACNQAEILIGLPFTDTDLNNTGGSFTTAAPVEPNSKYNLSWRITDDSPLTRKTIEITVTWNEKGKDKTLTFEYIKGQPTS